MALYLLGTGVLAEEFFAIAQQTGIDIAAFVANQNPDQVGGTLCGRPIVWVDDYPQGAECVCALSTTQRHRFIDQLAGRARFGNLVHPSATILPGTSLAEGTVVSTGVLIGSNTTIGEHVFINRGARIGHHTRVDNFVTIQPGANVAGLVHIGTRTYVGMGAIIVERRNIGQAVTIAAGAVVTRDVPDKVLVAGAPATIKRRNVDAR